MRDFHFPRFVSKGVINIKLDLSTKVTFAEFANAWIVEGKG